MKIQLALLLLCLRLTPGLAQNSTLVLDSTMFTADQQLSLLTNKDWVYHSGHNPLWARVDWNTTGWINRKPSDWSIKDSDPSGRAEGWFRLRLQLDSSFKGLPVFVRKSGWAAADLYVDGRLLASYGSTGTLGKPYAHYYFFNQLATSVPFKPGQTHLIALHLVDYPSPINPGRLKSEIGIDPNDSFRLVSGRYRTSIIQVMATSRLLILFRGTVSLVVSLLLWLLTWQPVGPKEKSVIQLLATQSSLVTANLAFAFACMIKPSWGDFMGVAGQSLGVLLDFLAVALLLAILLQLLDHPWASRAIWSLMLVPMVAFCIDHLGIVHPFPVSMVVFGLLVLSILSTLIAYRKRLQGAQWAIVIGLVLALLLALLSVLGGFNIAQNRISVIGLILTTSYPLAIPFSFLVYVALRFKEMLTEVRTQASAVVQITEEKRELLATQNQRLEQQVETRTAELNQSLTDLKNTQAQLIQKEKLASLGELTAGIAHEIQNPLNFVNNFSEVSTELIEELKEGPFQKLPTDEKEYAEEILGDLTSNLQKINHHGGRASSIVKGMLEHSRTESGEKRPTELNALADEYLKIAYHGFRGKDKSFNCELLTHFDPTLEPIDVAPQEIGRVLLNLYNNAFFAVLEQAKKTADPDYKPTVEVCTHRQNNQIRILVKDNGAGIPDSVKAKIFHPFFTTKPTGEGTGLGLSISYDIITKGHSGTLRVESQVGKGSTFVIELPQR
ncbi:hypothetical protein GCM10028805_52690 [Spirosoma harenae]